MTERIPVAPLSDRVLDEHDMARREALANSEEIEPTEEEKRNGWTTKTLTKYLAERFAAQSLHIDVNSLSRKSARRPNEQNHRYNVKRWRG